MLGVGTTYITQIIGVAYPAFMSFAALKSEGMEDDKQWLTYWVCFGSLTIMDQFVGIILQFIPFYYFLKLSILVWLFHPSTLGATWVFDNVLLPKMKEAEKRLSPHLKKMSNMGIKEMANIKGMVNKMSKNLKKENAQKEP